LLSHILVAVCQLKNRGAVNGISIASSMDALGELGVGFCGCTLILAVQVDLTLGVDTRGCFGSQDEAG
jgi:hypothetical protein